MHRTHAALLLAALVAATPWQGHATPQRDAEGRVTIAFSGADGSAATVSIDRRALDRRAAVTPGISIFTRRAGVPGSVLALRIDRAAEPLLTLTLTDQACAFATGESLCRLDLALPEERLRAVVSAFEKARVARLEIRTGGVMAMQETASLIGFRRAWR
jgi:hypothetical protein